MEVTVDVFTLLKMGVKLAQHKVQQYRLTTNETAVRTTNDGKIEGVKRKTIYDDYFYAFEGIPYAKPPLGELRFRAPQRVEPWNGILNCTNTKSKSMQKHLLLPIIEGSEDCLYLNIYAKNLTSETLLPVIVWIHGGGFLVGEASRDIYAPDYFMMHDVVLVAITYRLNVMGFLSLDDPDLGVPGNAGIKDQIMALNWIKDNIHHFNGDGENITLLGESAGSASIQILLSCPQTKNLFKKAIMMSGSAYCSWCFVPKKDWAFRLARKLGYDGTNNDKQIFRFLSKIDGKKLISASYQIMSRQDRREHLICTFGPTIEAYDSEGAVATKPFLDMYRDAWGHEIPIILGGTSFEGLFWYQTPKKFPYVINDLGDCEVMIPPDAKVGRSEPEIRSLGLEIKRVFFNNEEPNLDKHFFSYLHLTSFSLIWHGVYRTLLARLAYAKNAPTYLYRFDFDSPNFNHYRTLNCGSKQRGVCHADDISYLFYNIAATKLSTESSEFRTIKRLLGILVAFAKNSNPNCKEISPIHWEPIQSNQKEDIKCLNLSNEITILNLPEQEKLEMWNKFYTEETLI